MQQSRGTTAQKPPTRDVVAAAATARSSGETQALQPQPRPAVPESTFSLSPGRLHPLEFEVSGAHSIQGSSWQNPKQTFQRQLTHHRHPTLWFPPHSEPRGSSPLLTQFPPPGMPFPSKIIDCYLPRPRHSDTQFCPVHQERSPHLHPIRALNHQAYITQSWASPG